MSIITYGTIEIDTAKLPEASVTAMIRRGISHFFGSEQASKVTAFFSPDQDVPPTDTPEARAAKKAEFQATALAALLEGRVGVSTRGPAVDPVTTHLRRLAKAEVMNVLKEHQIKWPKKAEDVVTTPDGGKYTAAELIDRRIAHPKHAERLKREAQKAADDQAKKAKKISEAAKAEGLADL